MLSAFRELRARSKVLVVGCSALLVAGLAMVTVTAIGGEASTAVLLPGETTWSSGALSYEFGTNDTIDYGSPNVDTLPSVQAALKQGGLTLDRVWSYGGDSDAYITSKVTAANNAGMTCMFMLGQTDDLTWLEHVVQLTGPMGCHIFEFGNEPDNGGSIQGTIANYTSQWISAIPVLRSMPQCETNGVPDINKCAFGGPAVTWSASNNTLTNSKYPDDISYFLGTAKAAGVLPDFVTYHDYPCQKATSEAQCISMTPGDFQWNYDTVLSDEQTQLGHSIPTGVTEYNFDPGTANLYNWAGDSAFMSQWTQTALDAIVSLHIPFANQFTSLNYSGYGTLDMFSDSAPYGPKPQFNAMVAEVQKYGGPTTTASISTTTTASTTTTTKPVTTTTVKPATTTSTTAKPATTTSTTAKPATTTSTTAKPATTTSTTAKPATTTSTTAKPATTTSTTAKPATTTSTTAKPPQTPPLSPSSPANGYWLVGTDGGIFSFGDSLFYGSTGNLRIVRPVVGITPTADHRGYWLVASDGGTFAFGDARFHGSIPGLGLHPAGSGLAHSLSAPVVGIVPSADGGGYLMVGADGGVFAFGDARFEGSCTTIGGCVGTAVSVIPDSTGKGYWVVTSVGAVYSFGDARYYGAPGKLGVPVTSAAATPDGKGYRILFGNGEVFSYGDAANSGSPSSANFNGLDRASVIFPTADGKGYWVASALGKLFALGDAPNDGDTSTMHLNAPIIAGDGY